eukprot:g14598.t1
MRDRSKERCQDDIVKVKNNRQNAGIMAQKQSGWTMLPEHKAQYLSFFPKCDVDGNGTISAEEAVRYFRMSRLDNKTLGRIWRMADLDHDRKLNQEEFCLAMHLIMHSGKDKNSDENDQSVTQKPNRHNQQAARQQPQQQRQPRPYSQPAQQHAQQQGKQAQGRPSSEHGRAKEDPFAGLDDETHVPPPIIHSLSHTNPFDDWELLETASSSSSSSSTSSATPPRTQLTGSRSAPPSMNKSAARRSQSSVDARRAKFEQGASRQETPVRRRSTSAVDNANNPFNGVSVKLPAQPTTNDPVLQRHKSESTGLESLANNVNSLDSSDLIDLFGDFENATSQASIDSLIEQGEKKMTEGEKKMTEVKDAEQLEAERKLATLLSFGFDEDSTLQTNDTESPANLNPEQKQNWKRNKAREEIVSTESTYVQSLQTVLAEYQAPLIKEPSKYGTTEEQCKLLFGNMEIILGLHKTLLSDLQLAEVKRSSFGQVFSNLAPMFRMYRDYVKSYSSRIQLVDSLSNNRYFQTFLEEKRARTNGASLMSYLILPIQRIPRYQLLLQELLKHTPDNTPEKHTITRALTQVKEIGQEMDAAGKDAQEIAKLVDIQNKIRGAGFQVVVAGRRLVKQGILTKTRRDKPNKPYVVWLFNDVLLCVSFHGNIKEKLRVWTIQVLAVKNVGQGSMLILKSRDSMKKGEEIVFFTNTTNAGKSWATCLQTTISEAKKLLMDRQQQIAKAKQKTTQTRGPGLALTPLSSEFFLIPPENKERRKSAPMVLAEAPAPSARKQSLSPSFEEEEQINRAMGGPLALPSLTNISNLPILDQLAHFFG